MTIPRLKAMNLYWADNPPVHVMVAAYLGIGTSKNGGTGRPREVDENGQSLLDLLPRA